MTAPAAGHARTTVAVGYDGSGAAKGAVRWAAGYADDADDAEVVVTGTHNSEGGPGNTVTAVLNKVRCNVLITR